MKPADETTDESQRAPQLAAGSLAGFVVIWRQNQPAGTVLPLSRGQLVLGRGYQEELFADDDRVSREHCRVEFDGTLWTISDSGSKNGTYLNGARLENKRSTLGRELVLRVGRTLLWAVNDVRPFVDGVNVDANGLVRGGHSRRAWSEIELAAHAGSTLCLRGESGSGKELGARAFHEASSASPGSPFVAVNCAAIPEGLAERLLFGARRGAYSGATGDVQGYIQAANDGTLFLDEIAELDLRVQAKLLRVLETREVLPLGATRAERVELRVCVAAHADLREEVQEGRFREDLYYRVGRPEVKIPPLRERLDELPWLVAAEVARVDPNAKLSVRFIEECARRPWPGNVRELFGEVRRAAHRALRAKKPEISEEELDTEAGERLSDSAPPKDAKEGVKATALPDESRIEQALSESGGNVTQAARVLGVHRNQLRRWLSKRGSSPPEPEDERCACSPGRTRGSPRCPGSRRGQAASRG